ncbi:hypothetical protein IFM89_031214, partial [Coptis chinensis]
TESKRVPEACAQLLSTITIIGHFDQQTFSKKLNSNEGKVIKGIKIKQNAKKEEEKPKPKQADAKPNKPKQADAKPDKPQEIMILVDDAGGAWARIDHSPWNGCTLADFVMSFFLFIVGVAIALALKVRATYSDDMFKPQNIQIS